MRRAMLALLATLLVTMAVVVPAMASSPRIATDAGAGIGRLRGHPYGWSGAPPRPAAPAPAAFPVATPPPADGPAWPPHGIYATGYANGSVGGLGPLGSANGT